MNRLGIFCTYDSEGIIDDYIIYLLNDMKKILNHLTIICNGNLSEIGKKKLEKFTDDIVVRKNTGFDMEAWRQGILRNEKNFADYDELVLFNDSFYGPFQTFEKIFAEMNEKKSDADFWGITIHGKMPDETEICPYGYIPEHLQSYFLVFRSKIFHSKEFISYWKEASEAENFTKAILEHEVCLTKKFFDKGFTYAAYCDTRELEKDYDSKIDHSLILPEKLLKNYNCPVLKKKVFLLPREHFLHENYADEPRRSFEFIKNNTNYDVNLIWQNLLRKHNISAIKSNLALDYILPTNFSISDPKSALKETVIAVYLYYEDLFPECIKFLCNAPKEISIVVAVDSEKKKNLAEKLFNDFDRKCEVRIVNGRGRDLAALLVGCADVFEKFKYLCFIHDKKSIRPNESVAVGRAFFLMLWRNTLSSENFIKNIIATFENEPRLGLLVPPQPYNGEYKDIFFIAKCWSVLSYEKILELADEFGISKKLFDINTDPPAIGSVFWARTEALKKITEKNWKIEDFPAEPMPIDGTINHALERIFPFAAQSSGFYTGQLFTDIFAREEMENFIHFAKESAINPPPPQDVTLTAWVKLKVPEKYWFLLRPIKKFAKAILKIPSYLKEKF